MGFIDTYKHLEKLCGEILDDDRRISAYIDEMIDTPDGRNCVQGWDDDLKNLKHYRWVRNQISHDPDCNESNMCDPEDELWLRRFYSRIMKQTDPLSLYRKAHADFEVTFDVSPADASEPVKKRSHAGFLWVIALLLIAYVLLNKFGI